MLPELKIEILKGAIYYNRADGSEYANILRNLIIAYIENREINKA